MHYANNITRLFRNACSNGAQRAAPDDYNKSMNDMPWSGAARAQAERCLEHYLANVANPFRDLASRLRALPVIFGPGGLSFITTNGCVLVVDANNEIVPFIGPAMERARPSRRRQ